MYYFIRKHTFLQYNLKMHTVSGILAIYLELIWVPLNAFAIENVKMTTHIIHKALALELFSEIHFFFKGYENILLNSFSDG